MLSSKLYLKSLQRFPTETPRAMSSWEKSTTPLQTYPQRTSLVTYPQQTSLLTYPQRTSLLTYPQRTSLVTSQQSSNFFTEDHLPHTTQSHRPSKPAIGAFGTFLEVIDPPMCKKPRDIELIRSIPEHQLYKLHQLHKATCDPDVFGTDFGIYRFHFRDSLVQACEALPEIMNLGQYLSSSEDISTDPVLQKFCSYTLSNSRYETLSVIDSVCSDISMTMDMLRDLLLSTTLPQQEMNVAMNKMIYFIRQRVASVKKMCTVLGDSQPTAKNAYSFTALQKLKTQHSNSNLQVARVIFLSMLTKLDEHFLKLTLPLDKPPYTANMPVTVIAPDADTLHKNSLRMAQVPSLSAEQQTSSVALPIPDDQKRTRSFSLSVPDAQKRTRSFSLPIHDIESVSGRTHPQKSMMPHTDTMDPHDTSSAGRCLESLQVPHKTIPDTPNTSHLHDYIKEHIKTISAAVFRVHSDSTPDIHSDHFESSIRDDAKSTEHHTLLSSMRNNLESSTSDHLKGKRPRLYRQGSSTAGTTNLSGKLSPQSSLTAGTISLSGKLSPQSSLTASIQDLSQVSFLDEIETFDTVWQNLYNPPSHETFPFFICMDSTRSALYSQIPSEFVRLGSRYHDRVKRGWHSPLDVILSENKTLKNSQTVLKKHFESALKTVQKQRQSHKKQQDALHQLISFQERFQEITQRIYQIHYASNLVMAFDADYPDYCSDATMPEELVKKWTRSFHNDVLLSADLSSPVQAKRFKFLLHLNVVLAYQDLILTIHPTSLYKEYKKTQPLLFIASKMFYDLTQESLKTYEQHLLKEFPLCSYEGQSFFFRNLTLKQKIYNNKVVDIIKFAHSESADLVDILNADSLTVYYANNMHTIHKRKVLLSQNIQKMCEKIYTDQEILRRNFFHCCFAPHYSTEQKYENIRYMILLINDFLSTEQRRYIMKQVQLKRPEQIEPLIFSLILFYHHHQQQYIQSQPDLAPFLLPIFEKSQMMYIKFLFYHALKKEPDLVSQVSEILKILDPEAIPTVNVIPVDQTLKMLQSVYRNFEDANGVHSMSKARRDSCPTALFPYYDHTQGPYGIAVTENKLETTQGSYGVAVTENKLETTQGSYGVAVTENKLETTHNLRTQPVVAAFNLNNTVVYDYTDASFYQPATKSQFTTVVYDYTDAFYQPTTKNHFTTAPALHTEVPAIVNQFTTTPALHTEVSATVNQFTTAPALNTEVVEFHTSDLDTEVVADSSAASDLDTEVVADSSLDSEFHDTHHRPPSQNSILDNFLTEYSAIEKLYQSVVNQQSF